MVATCNRMRGVAKLIEQVRWGAWARLQAIVRWVRSLVVAYTAGAQIGIGLRARDRRLWFPRLGGVLLVVQVLLSLEFANLVSRRTCKWVFFKLDVWNRSLGLFAGHVLGWLASRSACQSDMRAS